MRYLRTSFLVRLLPLLLALQLCAPGELVVCAHDGGQGFEAGIAGSCLDAHARHLSVSAAAGHCSISSPEHGPCHDFALAYAQLRAGRSVLLTPQPAAPAGSLFIGLRGAPHALNSPAPAAWRNCLPTPDSGSPGAALPLRI